MSLPILSFRIIVAVALIAFVPCLFAIFDWTFASCYIDDGCGQIDAFVPIIVIFAALLASVLAGLAAALAFAVIGHLKWPFAE